MVHTVPGRRATLASAGVAGFDAGLWFGLNATGTTPRAVVERAKTGFVVPVRDWIARDAATAERGLRGWARHVHAAFGGA